jgi:hypothetical protein
MSSPGRFATPIYLCTIVALTEGYTYAAKFGALYLVRFCRPCQTLIVDYFPPSTWGGTFVQVLLSICSLLTDCNPQDPLVGSIAQQYLADQPLHDKTAAEWTRRYAQG